MPKLAKSGKGGIGGAVSGSLISSISRIEWKINDKYI